MILGPFPLGDLLERLIVSPDPALPGKFKATLERTGRVVVERSRHPLVDGARKLLELDFCPTVPLAMRHLGATYDSFVPAAIGELAKWTYSEGERQTLQRTRWKPFSGRTFNRSEASQAALP